MATEDLSKEMPHFALWQQKQNKTNEKRESGLETWLSP